MAEHGLQVPMPNEPLLTIYALAPVYARVKVYHRRVYFLILAKVCAVAMAMGLVKILAKVCAVAMAMGLVKNKA